MAEIQCNGLQLDRAMGSRVMVAPRPPCAICGVRDGETLDDLDGKRIIVCYSCRDGGVRELPATMNTRTRDRVLRVLARFPSGADLMDLALALGEDDEPGHQRIFAAISRAIRAGLVVFQGPKMERLYALAPKKRKACRKGER